MLLAARVGATVTGVLGLGLIASAAVVLYVFRPLTVRDV